VQYTVYGYDIMTHWIEVLDVFNASLERHRIEIIYNDGTIDTSEVGNPVCDGVHSGVWLTHNYYHADGNGNVTALESTLETLTASYRYDPFGNVTSQSGGLADANTYRFSSKEFHPASGNYYYGYRFYAPNLQRWLNRDPIWERGGINLYTFVWNAPPTWVDPRGLNNLCVNANCKGVDLSGYSYLSEEENTGPPVLREVPKPGECVDADAIHIPGEAYKIGDFKTVEIDCSDGKPKLIWGGLGKNPCWKFGEPKPPVGNWPHADQPQPPYRDKPPVKPKPPLKPWPRPGTDPA